MFIPHVAYEHSMQYYASRAPIVYRSLLWHRAQQGKVAELRAELVQPATKKDKNFSGKKIALKKIVANMTMSNNDMVALFPDREFGDQEDVRWRHLSLTSSAMLK
jgi:hypothetical protein